MRILFVEPFGQHKGHHSPESKRIINSLTKSNIEVTLVTYNGVRDNWAEMSKIEKHFSVVTYYGHWDRILNIIPKLHNFALGDNFANLLETTLALTLAIKESHNGKYDAIHVHSGSQVFLPIMIGSFTKNHNFVLNVYYPIQNEWQERGGLKVLIQSLSKLDADNCIRLVVSRIVQSKVTQFFFKPIYHRSLTKNRFAFLCHTNQIKMAYKLYLNGLIYDKFHVIPLGRELPQQCTTPQDVEREYLHLPKAGKIFLHFGVSHWGKNLELIFQAVQYMPKDFYLLFVGEQTGTNRDPKFLAKKYGWENNTIIVSRFIPENELAHYFCASDAVILSYVKEFATSASASVLNAACRFQLPVVATDIGQLGEFVRDYNLGIRFTPGSAQSLGEALITFMKLSQKERQTFKINFVKYASDLSWKEVGKRYKHLYSPNIADSPPEWIE